MSRLHKRKHKKVPCALLPIRDCTECANCQYIGDGDFLCDVRMKLVIQDWDMSTSCRKCGTFIQQN
jgi:hypothetical protein